MHNKHDNSRSNFDKAYFDKNLTVKNKSGETLQIKVTRKTPFNTNKKNVIVAGNSMTKFLRSDELSTVNELNSIIKLGEVSLEKQKLFKILKQDHQNSL